MGEAEKVPGGASGTTVQAPAPADRGQVAAFLGRVWGEQDPEATAAAHGITLEALQDLCQDSPEGHSWELEGYDEVRPDCYERCVCVVCRVEHADTSWLDDLADEVDEHGEACD